MQRHHLQAPLTEAMLAPLRAGDEVIINGSLYVARDAAHQRMAALLAEGKPLPFDPVGQLIYYMGPTPAKPGQVIGSAGPTTAGRVDRFTPALLAAGIKATIGKGYRAPAVRAAMVEHQAVYLAAIGGAGALISRSIQRCEVVAWPDLGPEALQRLEVTNFSCFVVNDLYGNDLYEQGQAQFQHKETQMNTTIPTVIPLWPDGAPGSESWAQVEIAGILPPDTPIVRNVTQPTLTAYLPDPAWATGTAAIICPGGAFHILAIEHEGAAVAQWLAARGVTAFVLNYRLLPTDDNFAKALGDIFVDRQRTMQRLLPIRPFALADGCQAIWLVRQNATAWGLDPHKIGMVGFSAGGRLLATVLAGYDQSSRPDFAGFIYGGLWEEFPAPADAPPLFAAAADDDAWSAPLCVRLYQLWKAGGHPAELHIYAKGGHGFGLRQQGLPTDRWIERFGEWLALQGFLERPS